MLSKILFAIIFCIYTTSDCLVTDQFHRECGDMDLRSYESLDRLENCSVITGNLVIVFLTLDQTSYESEQINARQFPNLKEITGFLFLHSIMFLKSLGAFFPNLTLIRGQRLFSNYALVIYDTDINEISLRNLLRINRGSVRIDGNNSNLCMPKIDWDRIIVNGRIFIGKNSTSSNCNKLSFDQCHSCVEDNKCWDNKKCQRFESPSKFVTGKGGDMTKRCHPLCLGQCYNKTAKGCYVCKDISENFECVENCSPQKLLNIETRRCIDVSECINLKRLIFEGRQCVLKCPSGYSNVVGGIETNKCERCKSRCPKPCNFPEEIHSVSSLELVGIGCTIVEGNLEINIIDDISNITAELQSYLGEIEEINGSLKIYRSTPITSLSFLNKLKIIRGAKNSPFSIRIYENQNLQSLLDWKLRADTKLQLMSGSIQFYNNFLLCINDINMFRDHVAYNSSKEKSLDLFENNGSKKSCINQLLETEARVLTHNSCTILWKDINATDNLKPNAYLIQFVSLETGSSLEDDELLVERDSCSSYSWQHIILKQSDWFINADKYLEYNLTGLQQYTTYAFAIQTYQYESADMSKLQSEIKNGASAVKTFKTPMNIPSKISNVRTIDKTTISITIAWDVVQNEIEALDFFYVDVVEKPDTNSFYDQRNYCLHPMVHQQIIEIYNNRDEDEIQDLEDTCCEECCKRRNGRKEIKIADLPTLEFKAMLEMLQFKVERPEIGPRRKIKKMKNYVNRFKTSTINRNITIRDLSPFSPYSFYVFTCTNDAKCSDYEVHNDRTEIDESRDQLEINSRNFKDFDEVVTIFFEEPKLVNGAITKYLIEIKQENENASVIIKTDCITRKQHELNGYKYIIKGLPLGEYMFRGRAVSIAGDGNLSEWHRFYVTERPKSKMWIIILVIILFVLATAIVISYYYKHKIMTILRFQNDKIFLLHDVQHDSTDFFEISLHHKSDKLSDISEYDE